MQVVGDFYDLCMQEKKLQVSHLSFLCISNLRCGCELRALNIHSMIVKFCWKNLNMELVLLIYNELNSCFFCL